MIDNKPDEAFSEFRDVGKRGSNTFLHDVEIAVEDNKYGPSWDKFIECLVNGHIFSIITSRGHEPESIRKAIEWIINDILSDDQKYEMYQNCLKFVYLYNVNKKYDGIPKNEVFTENPLIKDYLDVCGYYGIQSKWFISKFGDNTPEKAKGIAMRDFVSKIDKFGKEVGGKVSVGFSDDDLKFSEHIEKLFRDELSLKYVMTYNVYDTSGRGMKKTKITTEALDEIRRKKDELRWELRESSNTGSDPGKDSSVLPFTKWGNMTTRLYPSNQDNRQDDYAHQFNVNYNQDLDLYTQYGYSRKKEINEKVFGWKNRHLLGGDSVGDSMSKKSNKANTVIVTHVKKKKKKEEQTEAELQAILKKEVKELTAYVKNKNEFMVTEYIKCLSTVTFNKENQAIYKKLNVKSDDCCFPEDGDIGNVTDFYVSASKNIYCLFHWKKKVVNYVKGQEVKYIDAKCVINYKGLA